MSLNLCCSVPEINNSRSSRLVVISSIARTELHAARLGFPQPYITATVHEVNSNTAGCHNCRRLSRSGGLLVQCCNRCCRRLAFPSRPLTAHALLDLDLLTNVHSTRQVLAGDLFKVTGTLRTIDM
ncbi:hypothetical protein J6590_098812 [Homalodisca vitripennis]|nr:hypothetical protein J6590_098812 [Homalodisca vitripennis]